MEICVGAGEGRYEKFKENFRQASKEKHQESFPVKTRSKKYFHFFPLSFVLGQLFAMWKSIMKSKIEIRFA